MVKKLTCEESDELRQTLILLGGCTDMSAQFHSEPQIDTTYGYANGTEVMRDIRYPRQEFDEGLGDRLPCEHWYLLPDDPE